MNLGRPIATPACMPQRRRTTPDITNLLLNTTLTRTILRLRTRLQNQPHLKCREVMVVRRGREDLVPLFRRSCM